MTALVVDDSQITRRVLKLALKSHRIECCEACDGAEALSILTKNQSIAFVMVDWNMPNLSGYEFLKKVRSISKYDQLKIFVVTASDTIETLERAKAIGADDFLLKPISKSMIATKLSIHGLN